MSTILAADDLTPGIYVAVHSMKWLAANSHSEDQHTAHCPSSLGGLPMGVPLRVLEVSLPYACCAVLEPGGSEAGPVILDVRVIRLVRLREGYVRAIEEFGAPSSHESLSAEGDEIAAELE